MGRHIQRESILASHKNGVRFISISPLKSDIADEVQADWVAIRPNTDTALIIALCYEIIDKKLVDHAFLERYTTGFDKFSDYLVFTFLAVLM